MALNSRRAAEEKTGMVRWLRPEFKIRASRPCAARGLRLARLASKHRFQTFAIKQVEQFQRRSTWMFLTNFPFPNR